MNDNSGEQGQDHFWWLEPESIVHEPCLMYGDTPFEGDEADLLNAQQARITVLEAQLQDSEEWKAKYLHAGAEEALAAIELRKRITALTAAGKALEDELHADPAYEERIRRRRQQHSKDFQQLEAQVERLTAELQAATTGEVLLARKLSEQAIDLQAAKEDAERLIESLFKDVGAREQALALHQQRLA